MYCKTCKRTREMKKKVKLVERGTKRGKTMTAKTCVSHRMYAIVDSFCNGSLYFATIFGYCDVCNTNKVIGERTHTSVLRYPSVNTIQIRVRGTRAHSRYTPCGLTSPTVVEYHRILPSNRNLLHIFKGVNS